MDRRKAEGREDEKVRKNGRTSTGDGGLGGRGGVASFRYLATLSSPSPTTSSHTHTGSPCKSKLMAFLGKVTTVQPALERVRTGKEKNPLDLERR